LAEEGLPLVAIAYDLQHLELPFFFATEERLHRTQFLNDLVDRANKIICISKFTQQSLLKYFPVRENQLTAVPICIHERFTSICHEDMVNVLRSLGLSEGNYIFFPANFWPHKNHRMLLAAYSIYRLSYPNNALDLVFTGALEEPQVELREMTSNLGCEANVHFLGFLDEKELIALWQGCKGLVFPSLYEGFGIPVLEAMWFDKPVACSAIGSLPEVGDDAVVYFDPRKPESIAEAIGKIAHNEDLTMDLLERSRQYIKGFSQEAMAEQYLAVFSDALSKSKLPVPENVV
jgi:glycosyltransferase involved in cell wall biosynthesis